VGLAYHLQQRQRVTIEEADFDFQRQRDDLNEKTFLERVKESFSASLVNHANTRNQYNRQRGEGVDYQDDFMNDADDFPPSGNGFTAST